ncbi:MAG TPA: histidine phosphatase family protein [Fimbriimonadaceae bacterium]|nr:histidine phosphatase family protein [Fimbriimonadaceae bacterium]
MLDIIVVRHGESIRNHAALLAHQGNLGPLEAQINEDSYEPGWPLTEHGWEQARAAGAWIRSEFGAASLIGYVSPYYRTLQTARGLDLGIGFQQDWRLRERHWGDYSLAGEAYPVAQYLTDLAHCGEPDWRSGYPGGESVMDLLPNVRSFVQDRLFGLVEARIVIVTHGGTMRAFQALLTGGSELRPSSTPNCVLLHLRLQEVHRDGTATGDLVYEEPCPAATPHLQWQHFG